MVLFAVICGTCAELPLCLCSTALVVLMVIRWCSYFLDVAPRSTCVRLFLQCVSLWNMLHESDFAGDGLGAFKTAVNRTHRVRFN